MGLRTFTTGILILMDKNIWFGVQRRLFFAQGCFARVDTGIPTDFTIHGLEYVPHEFSIDLGIPNNISVQTVISNLTLLTNIPNNLTILGIPSNISIHASIPNFFAFDIKAPKEIAINTVLPDWIQPVAVAFEYLLYAIAAAIIILVISFVVIPLLRIFRTVICGCLLALAACSKDHGKPKGHTAVKLKLHNGKGSVRNHSQPYLVSVDKLQTIYDKIP